jgi:hypothetical protein
MSRKQTIVVVTIALFAGFLGGVVSQQVGLTALAQAGPAKRIEAQEFRLVDAKGRLLGLIKPAPTALSAEDSKSGSVVVVPFAERRSAGGGAIMLFDSQGEATWAAPEPISAYSRCSLRNSMVRGQACWEASRLAPPWPLWRSRKPWPTPS